MTAIYSYPVQIVIAPYSQPEYYTQNQLTAIANRIFSQATSFDKTGVTPCQFLFKQCLREKQYTMAVPLAAHRLIPLRGLIHQAIQFDCPEMISCLVNLGCNPNELDAANRTPVVHAFYPQRTRVLYALLLQETTQLSWSLWKDIYFSPQQDFCVQKALLQNLKYIDLPGQEGTDALSEIAAIGDEAVAQALLNKQIGLNGYSRETGMTPLSTAAYHKQNNFLSFLWIQGATPHFAERDGKTALHRAVESGNLAGVDFLVLVSVAKTLVNQPDNRGNTPLHTAFSGLDASNETIYGPIISSLLAAQADQQICNNAGVMPRDMISNTYAEHIKLNLLAAHANSIKNDEWKIHEGISAPVMCKAVMEVLFHHFSLEDPLHLSLWAALDRAAKFNSESLECSAKLETRIQQKKFVLLPIMASKNHLIYLVFVGGYYAVCNRGFGKPRQAASIEVFSIDPTRFKAPLLKDLHTSHAPYEYLYDTLPIQNLGGKNLTFSSPEWQSLALKIQQTGNCTYAGLKAAIRVSSCFFYLVKDKKQLPSAVQKAKIFSKELSTFCRLRFLSQYCCYKSPIDEPFVLRCWTKIALRLPEQFPLGKTFPPLEKAVMAIPPYFV